MLEEKVDKAIVVTKKDIANGVPLQWGACPIALAVRRTFHLDSGAYVGVGAGKCNVKGEWYTLPQSAMKFIGAFDHRKPVRPFAFILIKD